MAQKKGSRHCQVEEFRKDLKLQNVGNPVVLKGEEEYLVKWAVNLLTDSLIQVENRDMDLVVLDGTTVTYGQIEEEVLALSMLSPRKVIWVRDFKALEGASPLTGDDKTRDGFLKFLEEIGTEDNLLILSNETVNGATKIGKWVNKNSKSYDMTYLEEGALKGWIKKELHLAGKETDYRALEEIKMRSGYFNKGTRTNLMVLKGELEKVVALSDSGFVRVEDVKAAMSPSEDDFIFDLLDLIMSKNKAKAMKKMSVVLGHMKPYDITRRLVDNFQLMLAVRELLDGGFVEKQISEKLGVHPYRISIFSRYVRQVPANTIKKWLLWAYDSDWKMKSGFMEPQLSIELLIAKM